jgi:hypothetical protein
MSDFLIDEDASIGISSEAFMSKHSLIFLIQEGNALVMSHDMSEIGLNYMIFFFVGKVKGCNG